MGSRVLVTVANFVMKDMEQRALSSYLSSTPSWKRYDTLTALPQNQVQYFYEHLNSIESTIQFTIEMESTDILPFLDTRITHRSDGSPLTMVLRKSTHTDRYLVFKSHHPLAHKVAVARTLLNRAERICTDLSDTEKEKEYVAKALQNNGYSSGLVLKHWTPTSQPPPPERDTPTATVTLPYIRHLSETIQKILAPLRIWTCFRSHCTLRQTLVRLKDQTPLQK